jgi:hypothetical protein
MWKSSATFPKGRYSTGFCSAPWLGFFMLSVTVLTIISISSVVPFCHAATTSKTPTKGFNEEEDSPLSSSTLPKDKTQAKEQQQTIYQNNPPASSDEQLQKKRIQRERQFKASVAKMDQDDKKKAQRQKRADSRLVRRILKAAKRDLHYDVLGLRNRWNYPIFGTHLLKRITPKDIKRAFYKMAKLIHPDKNLDDRAEEAFIQLERSAAILLDEVARNDYDTKIATEIRERRKLQAQTIQKYFNFFVRRGNLVASVMFRVIKPIYIPILILGALLV